jgi:hypothetical protein
MLLDELNKLSSLMVLVLAAVGFWNEWEIGLYIYIGLTAVITNKAL